jgi:hypothetical protein
MKTLEIKVHEIAVDGLPNDDSGALTGRVAFIMDGCIVSGFWIPRGESPSVDEKLDKYGSDLPGAWEANDDVGDGRLYVGVTHWVEFPMMLGVIEEHKSAQEGMRLRAKRRALANGR